MNRLLSQATSRFNVTPPPILKCPKQRPIATGTERTKNSARVSAWGTGIYFAHPYTSWGRAQNERYNCLFRAFVPKGASIKQYSAEEILAAADELNGRPRKKLGYHTPEGLFDAFLDSVFAARRLRIPRSWIEFCLLSEKSLSPFSCFRGGLVV